MTGDDGKSWVGLEHGSEIDITTPSPRKDWGNAAWFDEPDQ